MVCSNPEVARLSDEMYKRKQKCRAFYSADIAHKVVIMRRDNEVAFSYEMRV